MTENDRKAIRETLSEKFDKKMSRDYENRIFVMCSTLAENYEEELEDVYKKYSYEKIGELFFVETDKDVEQILQGIGNLVISWDSHVYTELRKRRELENSQLTQGIKVEKGEFPCRNRDCKSKECYFYLSQDRSADEAMTVNVTCTKCGTRYKFN